MALPVQQFLCDVCLIAVGYELFVPSLYNQDCVCTDGPAVMGSILVVDIVQLQYACSSIGLRRAPPVQQFLCDPCPDCNQQRASCTICTIQDLAGLAVTTGCVHLPALDQAWMQ